MTLKISFLIYKFLRFFDKILLTTFNKSFLIHFNDFFNKDFYISKFINNKKTEFFIPNSTVKYRVDTLYSKEPETIEWIDEFNTQKPIFWDVGANIGLYSLYAARKFENIKIVSFEPSTSNLRVLSRNISINNLSEKIKINQLPLNDQTNINLNMYEPEFIEGWSMNSFGALTDYKGEKFSEKQKYSILGTTINFLIDNNILEVPNYLKIDVDGLEHKILKGADKLLSSDKIKSILIELNENYLEQYNEVISIMNKFDFKLKYKKHAKMYDTNKKFSSVYNYIFEKKI